MPPFLQVTSQQDLSLEIKDCVSGELTSSLISSKPSIILSNSLSVFLRSFSKANHSPSVKSLSCFEKNRVRIISFSRRPRRALQVIFFFHQTFLLTIISLILPIAFVGFSPLGQTSTQFIIV